MKTILDKIPISTVAIVMSHIDKKKSGCWEWTKATNGHGYGTFHVERKHSKANFAAHRTVYAFYKGEPKQSLDHLCRNTLCVNPDHLEEVTQKENVRRGKAKKTHCVRGHELSDKNTYTISRPKPRGVEKLCKICHNIRQRGYYRKRINK